MSPAPETPTSPREAASGEAPLEASAQPDAEGLGEAPTDVLSAAAPRPAASAVPTRESASAPVRPSVHIGTVEVLVVEAGSRAAASPSSPSDPAAGLASRRYLRNL